MSGKTICANCEYFVIRNGNGECHLNPPLAIGRMQARNVPAPNGPPVQFRSGFAFPNVALTDFCKHHAHRANYNIAATGEVAISISTLNDVMATEQHSQDSEYIRGNPDDQENNPWTEDSDDGGTNDPMFSEGPLPTMTEDPAPVPETDPPIDADKLARVMVKPPDPQALAKRYASNYPRCVFIHLPRSWSSWEEQSYWRRVPWVVCNLGGPVSVRKLCHGRTQKVHQDSSD